MEADMKRITWHWTAGGHKANATDLAAYHLIIEGDGKVVRGVHPFSANSPIKNPRDASTYAAHTRNLNTDNIGLALAAMRQAKERPFNAGPSPITDAQVEVLIDQTASLCRQYGIPVTRETVLSHAEVQPTLGVAQRNKWDITWLPGMSSVGDPIEVGNRLRARVRAKMAPPAHPRASIDATAPTQRPTGLAGFISWLLSFLGKGGPA